MAQATRAMLLRQGNHGISMHKAASFMLSLGSVVRPHQATHYPILLVRHTRPCCRSLQGMQSQRVPQTMLMDPLRVTQALLPSASPPLQHLGEHHQINLTRVCSKMCVLKSNLIHAWLHP